MNDEELKKQLLEWQPHLPEEAGFRRSVFHRITHLEETAPLSTSIRGIVDWVTRPKFGLPAATAILAFTTWMAIHNGTISRDETWTNLSANYGQLINPISHSNSYHSR